jgi:hypothetical protein
VKRVRVRRLVNITSELPEQAARYASYNSCRNGQPKQPIAQSPGCRTRR